MRDSIVFYRSFYEAVKDLSPEDFKQSVEAIMEYGLNDNEVNASGVARAVFIMAKPQIDKNNKRYENGLKGGRKPSDNQNTTKTEPSNNQDVTKCEPNVNDNVNDNVNVKKSIAPCDKSPCAGKFLLNDATEYEVSENDVVTYQQLYPGIDVMQELRNIEAWCLSNPKNRKTRNGAKRFLNAWLSRSQNSARPKRSDGCKNNKFNDFPQHSYNMPELEKQLLGNGDDDRVEGIN